MFSRRFSTSIRSLVYCTLVFAVTVAVLIFVNKNVDSGTTTAQSAENESVATPAAVFAGTGTGAIADGGPGFPPDFGAPLVVSFAVSGMTAPLTAVSVDITMDHSWAGDVEVKLVSPGGAVSADVVNRIGLGVAPGNELFGDGSNFGATYNFIDTAPSGAADNIWSKALATNGNPACNDTCIIPGGNYRTTDNSGSFTILTNAFAGLSTAQVNGTWTLTFRDAFEGDIGNVTTANLTLTGSTGAPVPDSLADFDGDGKTDYAVIRLAGGLGSQATWHIMLNNYNFYTRNWGFASDTFVPADFDGDGKDDVAIWRPGSPAPGPPSKFYIIQSLTNTIRIEDWGRGSDDPSVVGDYNNDGRDDFAVYRPGATLGAQSFWYWKSSAGGTVINTMPWGLSGDSPAPGDYDGDGRMDFAVQRTSGANGVFYIRYTNGTAPSITTFGNADDWVVPGDYDGDGRTDLCVVGPVSGLLQWTFRPSGGGSDVVDTWGLPDDYPTPGDYNGDGKADYAVWRFGTQSTFWVMRPVTRVIDARNWGLNDDIPVTYTFAH